MAEVVTPNCRAVSAMVRPIFSTGFLAKCALNPGRAPRRLPPLNASTETPRFSHAVTIIFPASTTRSFIESCPVIFLSTSRRIRSTNSSRPNILSSQRAFSLLFRKVKTWDHPPKVRISPPLQDLPYDFHPFHPANIAGKLSWLWKYLDRTRKVHNQYPAIALSSCP